MKSATIHHMNSIIIVLSCLVAFYIPFELFLIAYGVLGPLHYLTEIGWLHKKNYYTKGKYDYLYLTIVCAILVYLNFKPLKNYGIMADLLLFSLLSSIAFVYAKEWVMRFIIMGFAAIIIAVLNNAPAYFTWAAIFLPTIIHVYLFTALFMFYGVLKEKSIPGLISVGVLIVCTSMFFIIQPQSLNYTVSAYAQKSYNVFAELNFRLIQLFNLGQLSNVKEVFTSNAGFVIMRFIAFAYVYHYLNWFSKTSVIKWHNVPKSSLIITLIIWVFSVALYWLDYNLGLKVLFFLSFLHVFLEFPLNIVSFTGIGRELGALIKNKG